jgi:hypothetical protein
VTENDNRGDTGGKKRLSRGVNNGKKGEDARGEGEIDVVLLDKVPGSLLSESFGRGYGGKGRVSRRRREAETERLRTVDVLSALDRHGSSFLVLHELGVLVEVIQVMRDRDTQWCCSRYPRRPCRQGQQRGDPRSG